MLKEGVKVGLARLNDDTVKSCSAVRESSWSEGDVEIGVAEPSDAKAKACSVVKEPSLPLEGVEVKMVKSSDAVVKSCSAVEEPALPLEGEEVGVVEPSVAGVKARKRKKRRVKADLSKDGRGRGQRELKRPVAVVLSAGARRRSERGTKRRAKVVVSAKPRERDRRQESCGLVWTSIQGWQSSGQFLADGLREGSTGVDDDKATGLGMKTSWSLVDGTPDKSEGQNQVWDPGWASAGRGGVVVLFY